MKTKANIFKRLPGAAALIIGMALVVAATALVSCDNGTDPSGGKTVTDLQVTTSPTKRGYFVGDTLDTTGMVVEASFSDGTKDDAYTGYTLEREDGTAIANGDTLSTATIFSTTNSNSGDTIMVTAPGLTEWYDKGFFNIQVYDDVTKDSITGQAGHQWSDSSDNYRRTASFSGDGSTTLTFTEKDSNGTTTRAIFTLTLTWGDAATDSSMGSANKGFAVTGTYSVTESANYNSLQSEVKSMFGNTAAQASTALPENLKLVIARSVNDKYLYLTDGNKRILLGDLLSNAE
jgi:hypothetical protein